MGEGDGERGGGGRWVREIERETKKKGIRHL